MFSCWDTQNCCPNQIYSMRCRLQNIKGETLVRDCSSSFPVHFLLNWVPDDINWRPSPFLLNKYVVMNMRGKKYADNFLQPKSRASPLVCTNFFKGETSASTPFGRSRARPLTRPRWSSCYSFRQILNFLTEREPTLYVKLSKTEKELSSGVIATMALRVWSEKLILSALCHAVESREEQGEMLWERERLGQTSRM